MTSADGLPPSAAFLMRHGLVRLVSVAMVPDRVCAIELEADWTQSFAQNAYAVFGRGVDYSVPWWDQNTLRGPREATR